MYAFMENFGWEAIGFAFLTPFVAYFYDSLGRPHIFGAVLAIALLFYGMVRKLEGKARRLLIGPLVMSALGVINQLVSAKANDRLYLENSNKLLFVPLFLFVSMAAAPTLTNVSGNVFKYTSLVLLLTGILPGDAYLYFVAILPVLLFMMLIIALPIDLMNIEQESKPGHGAAARPMPPVPDPHPAH